mgnify:CR=1 FL=1
MGKDQLATVACPGDGCAQLKQFECPPHCSDFGDQCQHRKCIEWNKNKINKRGGGPCMKHEPIQDHVNRTLSIIWPRLPRLPPATSSVQLLRRRRLILITTTFPHALQLLKLQHCANVLNGVPNVHWIVAEDAASPSPEVKALLTASAIPHEHLSVGPTRKGGNAQRNAALKLIRRKKLQVPRR